MSDVVGIVLAGGRGERARPLTMKAPGYLRSKAAMSFCGRRLILWLLEIMRLQGIEDFYVVAHGKENRYQIKTLAGFGEAHDVRIRYSRVRFDASNTGSADAALRNLDYWGLDRPALVFPSDSLFDFSLAEMVDAHHAGGAVVTVAAMSRGPVEVAGKYGAMLTTPEGQITDFVEKPTLTELRESFPAPSEEEFERLPLLTNAGMYLLDTLQARKVAGDPDLSAQRQRRLDFGMDFLPWLVGSGYTVLAHPIARVGDLGTVADYLQTMIEVLRGQFAAAAALMGEPFDPARRVWIPHDTLEMRDEVTGKSLEEKLDESLVEIEGNVRLGRYVMVGPGVRLHDCNVDDGVEIGESVDIRRSAVRDGVMIGAHAAVSDCYLGSMAEVRSTAERRTVLEQYVAVGDEVVLQEGVTLSGNVSVWPRVKIPAGVRIPPGTEVRDSNDVLRYL